MSPLAEENRIVSPAPLVDIGANLTHESFSDDIEAVLERAYAAGVETLVLTGTDAASIDASIALRERFDDSEATLPALRSTAGAHPHHASEWTPALERQIRDAVAQPGVIAVGECGLDFNRNYSSEREQLNAFEAQLQIAAELKLPLFLHERDASRPMFDILKQWRDDLSRAVIHCFTGDRTTLYRYLDLDLYIGVTGWLCDERRGGDLRDALPEIPPNRLMIETDCPYLLPRHLPGKVKARRHEPALLPWICREAARLRGVSEKTLAESTTATASDFFAL
ncbi:TatD family hydrolase [Carnimonas nigrificans]|uniref:TatD family hydrolase n=1 Tax=Carnimonas nigrificans TaxID=64323 RepID=UPI00047067F8|nr:TatD family hydrolase [Carnimonas nigrificans]